VRPYQFFSQFFHAVERSWEREKENRWGPVRWIWNLSRWGIGGLPDAEIQTVGAESSLSNNSRFAPPKELILPHPRLQDRAFVLVPTCRYRRRTGVIPLIGHKQFKKNVE